MMQRTFICILREMTPQNSDAMSYYDFSSGKLVKYPFDTGFKPSTMTTSLQNVENSTITVPAIVQGRLYIALGGNFDQQTYFPDYKNEEPIYNATNTTLLFDKVEMTGKIETSADGKKWHYINMNLTNVDYYSFPIAFEAINKDTLMKQHHGYFAPRDAIINEFQNIPPTVISLLVGKQPAPQFEMTRTRLLLQS